MNVDKDMQKINPKIYSINSRISIFRTTNGGVLVMINRKSRIIMKDGHKIIENVKKINKIEKDVKITIKIKAPLCSKTKTFLEKKGVFLDIIKP
jgi:hypothetical protein